jgi:hypothetical protein
MKSLLTNIFLFGFLLTKAQIEIKYHFKSQCDSLIAQDSISFELQNMVTNESYYSENLKVLITTLFFGLFYL